VSVIDAEERFYLESKGWVLDPQLGWWKDPKRPGYSQHGDALILERHADKAALKATVDTLRACANEVKGTPVAGRWNLRADALERRGTS
jgi:hypothetical protein